MDTRTPTPLDLELETANLKWQISSCHWAVEGGACHLELMGLVPNTWILVLSSYFSYDQLS